MQPIEINAEWIIDQADRCTGCRACLDSCPTWAATGDDLFTPTMRLKTAAAIAKGAAIEDHQIESIYNCPKCMRCTDVCPEGIDTAAVIHRTREVLAHRGLGPLKKHAAVIDNIMTSGNSVQGNPQTRLDWLPEAFPEHETETLLFLGCLPSYLVTESARATYLVLKKLGVDFMILRDEGCCGTYLYESGRTDLAGEFFEQNARRFSSLGVKEILVPCNGCLKCFKYYYPALLGETAFSVRHVVEVIHPLLKQYPKALKQLGQTVTYQDPCRLARGEHLVEEPREILTLCGLDLAEMPLNRQEAACCGAGGGIRSVYRRLSTDIAAALLAAAPTETLVSTCPFCTFNLNHAASRKQTGNNVVYFTSAVLEALEE